MMMKFALLLQSVLFVASVVDVKFVSCRQEDEQIVVRRLREVQHPDPDRYLQEMKTRRDKEVGGSGSCPLTMDLGECNIQVQDQLECGYDYIFFGCTEEELECLPSLSCTCNLFGDGDWACLADGMSASCPGGDEGPETRGQYCTPPSQLELEEEQEQETMDDEGLYITIDPELNFTYSVIVYPPDDYYADFSNDFYITDDVNGDDLVFIIDDDDDDNGDGDNTLVGGSGIIQILPGDDPDSDDDYTVEYTWDRDGDDDSCKTIPELLCGEGAEDFTTLCDLWTENFPDDTGVDSITLFAPTETAFQTAFELFSEAEYSPTYNEFVDIFNFHVAPGTVLVKNLECGELLEMNSNSGSSRTKCGRDNDSKRGVDYLIQKGGGNRKNDIEPIILAADIMACNDSVVHVISEVMLPNFINDLI